jgi:anti-sigma regulatory factor (Ser/Thr protein kinase)
MAAWTFASEDARMAINARTQFVDFLRSIGSADELVNKAELVFGELLGNVVRHAPGPTEISLHLGSDAATLHIIDSGPAFPVNQPHLPADVLSELGRGLFIVQQLAVKVRVERIPDRGNHTIVTL